MGFKGRDIEVCEIDQTKYLVATCDSCGGIGEKEFDKIKVPAELVGRLTTRVAFMELIAVGATPKMMTISITSEPEPTAVNILAGIFAELKVAGFSKLPRVISTEKNISTCQTGLGIGITGICLKDELRVHRSKPGDNVFCLGIPKFGDQVTSADNYEIVQIKDLKKWTRHQEVHDILPIGSRGILEESNQLANQVNCQFIQYNYSIDVKKSAGPSTCIIFTCPDNFVPEYPDILSLTKIGCFISK